MLFYILCCLSAILQSAVCLHATLQSAVYLLPLLPATSAACCLPLRQFPLLAGALGSATIRPLCSQDTTMAAWYPTTDHSVLTVHSVLPVHSVLTVHSVLAVNNMLAD